MRIYPGRLCRVVIGHHGQLVIRNDHVNLTIKAGATVRVSDPVERTEGLENGYGDEVLVKLETDPRPIYTYVPLAFLEPA